MIEEAYNLIIALANQLIFTDVRIFEPNRRSHIKL